MLPIVIPTPVEKGPINKRRKDPLQRLKMVRRKRLRRYGIRRKRVGPWIDIVQSMHKLYLLRLKEMQDLRGSNTLTISFTPMLDKDKGEDRLLPVRRKR